MTAESNKGLVRRQFDEVWNGGNWATVDELFASEYVNHDPYNPNQGTGPEGFKQRVSGYRSVLHNFDLRVERRRDQLVVAISLVRRSVKTSVGVR